MSKVLHLISESLQPSVRELITRTNNYTLGKAMTTTGCLQKKVASYPMQPPPLTQRAREKWKYGQPNRACSFTLGNFLDSTDKGKSGKTYPFRSAFCLETQHFPDSPNRPEFPSTLLLPGETYHQKSVFKFGL